MQYFIIIVCLATQIIFTISQPFYCPPTNCVDLTQINVLTFTKNLYAHDSYNNRYPQLNCVDGSACSDDPHLMSVQCKNQGVDALFHVNWICTALEDDTNLSIMMYESNPVCQWYRYPSDNQYVYKDSCILQYKLKYTSVEKQIDSIFNLYLAMIFYIVLAIIITTCLCSIFEFIAKSYGMTDNSKYPTTGYSSSTETVNNTMKTNKNTSHGSTNNSSYPTHHNSDYSSHHDSDYSSHHNSDNSYDL